MSYPEWGLINLYDSKRQGFSFLIEHFNGFRELLNHSNAAMELLKLYEEPDPLSIDTDWTYLEKRQYIILSEKIEMIFISLQLFYHLDKTGIQNLKKIAISKYQKKKMLTEIYGLWDLSTTVALCAMIIRKENPTLYANIPSINTFVRYLKSNDIRYLDYIVELLEKIEI